LPKAPALDPSSFQPIDCDGHPAIPTTRVLFRYLDAYWREHVMRRGLETDKPYRERDDQGAALRNSAGDAPAAASIGQCAGQA
jgi:hypothetical protein